MDADKLCELTVHEVTYQLWTWPGKIRKCMEAGRPYEASLLEHIYQQKFTGLAVDAGANLGNHTVYFGAVCGLRVAAFEPLYPGTLRRNVELNGITDRVSVYPVALGESAGIAWHVKKGRLTGKKRTGPKLIVRDLDSYELADVSLMKFDIEGMEPAALRGAEKTIRRERPVLYIEAWSPKEDAAAGKVLEPWGYKRTGTFRHSPGSTLMVKWENGA